MSFNALPGETLLLPISKGRKEHLYVVVVESVGNPQETIVVNLTSIRPNSDRTVELDANSHPFVHHPTIVEYKFAKIVKTQSLIDAVNSGYYQTHQPFSMEVLFTIQKGLLKSRFTPNKIKDFYRQHHR